jgi:uncharacterized protein YcfL
MKFIFTIVFMLILLTGCGSRLSTNDLATEVQKSVEEALVGKEIKIESLVLTRISEDSNMYKGILETDEPNGKFVYAVDVSYDGENFTWELDGGRQR